MRLGIVTDQVIVQPKIGFRFILRRMEMVERFVRFLDGPERPLDWGLHMYSTSPASDVRLKEPFLRPDLGSARHHVTLGSGGGLHRVATKAGDYDPPVTDGFALAVRRGGLAEDAGGGSAEPGSGLRNDGPSIRIVIQ